jgi:hypothetical protein
MTFAILDARRLLLEALDESHARLSRDATGATIGGDAVRIDRTEVGARRDVPGLQVDAGAERLEHTAAHGMRRAGRNRTGRDARDRCRA